MDDYCGTQRGLDTHKNRNEPPCNFCIKFRDNPAPRIAASSPKVRGRATQAQCGTPAGYGQHRANNEPACDDCKAAIAEYARARQYKKLGLAVPPGAPPIGRKLRPCGTYAAYRRHLHRGEPVDEACRTANNDYRNKYRR